MRGVHCIPVNISQLTTFGPWKRVESMSHLFGLSFVTSPTTNNDVSPCLRTSGLITSECGPGSYYGQDSDKGQYGSQSDEWTLQTSTGAWLHRRLAVGGGFQ